MDTTIRARAATLRSEYASEMRASSKAHDRGDKAASQEHYKRALIARDELNALGFDLFGALPEGGSR